MNNFLIGFISGICLILLIKLTHYVVSDLIDINKQLEEFHRKAMYGPKEDIYGLRLDLIEFYKKRIYHVAHGNRARNIFLIIQTRQKYEK